jgi:hypothetical protein
MHPRQRAREAASGPDPQAVNWQLRVVIAYDETAAGKHALRVRAGLRRNRAGHGEVHPATWSFGRLAEAGWAEAATGDAARADILIIAASRPDPLPTAVRRWTEAAIRRKQGSAATVVALFGPEENPDRRGSSRLEAIRSMAHGAGLDFFAPADQEAT